jgi:hypothetical protein
VAVPVWLYWTLRSIQFWSRAMTSALLMGSLGAALAGAAGTAVTATAINVVARVDRSMVRRDIVDISSSPSPVPSRAFPTMRREMFW